MYKMGNTDDLNTKQNILKEQQNLQYGVVNSGGGQFAINMINTVTSLYGLDINSLVSEIWPQHKTEVAQLQEQYEKVQDGISADQWFYTEQIMNAQKDLNNTTFQVLQNIFKNMQQQQIYFKELVTDDFEISLSSTAVLGIWVLFIFIYLILVT